MKIIEDVLDFLAFLFLLGACLGVAFGVVLPVVTDKEDITSKTIEDKTAPKIKGFEDVSNYDGTLSKLEVVLTTQVQDFGVPYPKRYKVKEDTTKPELNIDITQIYKADVRTVGVSAYNSLSGIDPSNSERYKVEYDYGDTDDPDDDFYYFKKQ